MAKSLHCMALTTDLVYEDIVWILGSEVPRCSVIRDDFVGNAHDDVHEIVLCFLQLANEQSPVKE